MALIKCSECGKDISDQASSCPSCGHPRVNVVATNLPTQYSRSISIEKFLLLEYATFGFYSLYWMYKQWKLVEKEQNLSIYPFWRTIFGSLWTGSLAKQIGILVKTKNIDINYNYWMIGISFFLLSITWRLQDPYWLLSFLSFIPLLPLVSTTNRYYEIVDKDLPSKRLKWWQIVLIILGVILMSSVVWDSFFPMPE